ncbi:MAG TPA: anthrone oxygenase family protein [Pilimelia sp.]|nr:anthrone oxygenase family protein [Pilimelia sp.]
MTHDQYGALALVAATVTAGLSAGLFVAYANSVMPGLARGDDRTLVVAMQNINVAILNGWFAASFAGAPLLTALAAVLHATGPTRPALPWIGAALLLYALALAITFAGNIPLNDRLAAAGEPDRIGDLAAVRAAFEAAWVRLNLLRAVTHVASFGLLTWALVLHGRLTAAAGT